VGEATIESHGSHILDKLGARDRAQAVALGHEVGMIKPGSADLGIAERRAAAQESPSGPASGAATAPEIGWRPRPEHCPYDLDPAVQPSCA
jgi:hypothetical protein